MDSLAVLSFIFGMGLLTWSAMLMSAANGASRLSLWARPEYTPARSIAIRAVGAGFVVFGVVLLGPAIGIASSAIGLATFVPGVIIIALHNRRLEG